MKILIIGCKGFIGHYAFQHFSQKAGVECWGADVVVDYVAERYLLLDSTNSDFNELFEEHAFDVCINCSGAASVPDSLQHPLRDFTLNTFNVIRILDAVRKHAPLCRFINLSSAAVYGNPRNLPVAETDAGDPLSPYGMHKHYAEEICKEYYKHFGIHSSSLRIFSAYGPGLKKQLLWDIAQKTKTAEGHIRLFGTGEETRDFIYVEDVIACVDLVLEKGSFDAAVYNVANGIQIKIKDLAGILAFYLGFNGSIHFSGESRPGDPVSWQADISLMRTLGYEPQYSIENGINNYVQWLNQERLLG